MKSKFTYVGIRVKDLEKSINFYTAMLGMNVKNRSKITQTKGEAVTLETEDGGFTLELNYYERDSPYYGEYVTGEALDHLAFSVKDLNETLKTVRTSGYRVISEHKSNGNSWAYIEDPNGIWIELF